MGSVVEGCREQVHFLGSAGGIAVWILKKYKVFSADAICASDAIFMATEQAFGSFLLTLSPVPLYTRGEHLVRPHRVRVSQG